MLRAGLAFLTMAALALPARAARSTAVPSMSVIPAMLDAVKMATNSGDVPQNVDFAMKSVILASFLDANRVSTRWARSARR